MFQNNNIANTQKNCCNTNTERPIYTFNKIKYKQKYKQNSQHQNKSKFSMQVHIKCRSILDLIPSLEGSSLYQFRETFTIGLSNYFGVIYDENIPACQNYITLLKAEARNRNQK